MKITLLAVGKTTSEEIKNLCADYTSRMKRYTRFELLMLDNTSIRWTDPEKIKQKEGELILKKINAGDFITLLQDRGKEFNSTQFASWIGNLTNQSVKSLCFIIGGAYGFSEAVFQRANAVISLSKMTFNHQLVRAVFCEQLYRAYTILNNEPYHHE